MAARVPSRVAASSAYVHAPPPPFVEANSPPSAPGAITLTRTDGTVTASWGAVANATKYHITYSSDGENSWTAAADNHSESSITINGVDNTKTYVVGVRAGNDNGWSGWTNSAPIAPQLPAAPASVTLTRSAGELTVNWTAVSEATSYNINLSDDGTNSWTRAVNGATGTSNTINTGIANGLWYIAAVQPVNSKGVGGWTNSDFVAPIYTPGQVGNLRATRSGTGISVTWDAPANNGGSAVTGYDVNYTVDGVHSWTRAHTNQPGTSATISDVSNAVDYVVAVRANNGVGTGAWTNSAPVAGLAGPTSVTALKGGDYVEGEWSAVAGATGYDVNLLYFQNEYHYRVETNMSGTSRRIYINDGGAFSPEQFVIAVRARNDHGPGAWVNSPPATAAPELDASSVTTTTATLTISNYSGDWHYQANTGPDTSCSTAQTGATVNLTSLTAGTEYTYTAYDKSGCASADAIASETFTTIAATLSVVRRQTTATLTLAGHTAQWWYDANTGPDTTCRGPIAAGTSSVDLTGLTEHQQYTYTAYSATGCNSADSLTSLTFEPSDDELDAGSITAVAAALTLTNHTGNWWLRETSPSTGTCTAGEADFSHALSGLVPGTEYTYKAYDVSTCGDTHVISDETFTTGGVSVSNLSRNQTFVCFMGAINGSNSGCAIGFTTGSAANGYTLHSVTVRIGEGSSQKPSGFAISLREPDTTDSDKPGNAVLNATLNGSTPTGAGTYTYTCAGTGCSLDQNETYFVAMTSTQTTGTRYHEWQSVNWTDEDKIPSSNGWSISDEVRQGSNWNTKSVNYALNMKVAATVNPAPLTASDISGTGATLTVANHSGAWSYKGISGTSASTSCVDVSSGTTATLSSLTANNLYGYTAYSGANCTGTELAREYFSTNDFDVGNLGEGAASGSCLVGYSAGSRKCAMPFTTGDRSGGYTLKSITAEFNAKQEITGTLGNIIVAIHAEDTVNSANPAATAKVTLDGNNPNTAGLYSYTCSGSDCSLSKETKYFIVMSTADTDGVKFYQMKLTTSDAEAVHPSGNEWSIENVGREKNGSAAWVDLASSQTGLLHIAADD